MRLLSPIPIVTGLIAEWLVLHFAFDLSWKKAALVDVVMNAASAAAGIVLIPLAGFPLIFVLLGTLNFLLSYFLAVLVSTAIEAAVIRWLFKIPLHRRRLWALCGANGLSTGIAFISILLDISWSWFPTLRFFRF